MTDTSHPTDVAVPVPADRADARDERRSSRRRFLDRSPRERAVALVWCALLLTVMLGFAGFAVDLSNWWFQAERLQRAADAGAHAGVVYLPADLTSATSTARAEVAKNGFRSTGGDQNSTVTVTQEPNPNRLRVNVSTTVRSYFVGLLGVDEVTLNREAVAEYISPVPMGSPENKLGNDPDEGDTSTQLWVNIAAPDAGKQQGERYGSKVCDSSPREYGCTGSTSDEYSEDGYFFTVEVHDAPAGQPLNIQIFDAPFVYNDNNCSTGSSGPSWPSSSQLNTLRGINSSRYSGTDTGGSSWNNTTRYAGGSSSPFCTGDHNFGGQDMLTTFVVRAPDDTPWNDTDNPALSTSTCTPRQVKAYYPSKSGNPSIYEYLHPSDGRSDSEAVYNNDDTITFAEGYRRWVTICQIPAGSVVEGEYLLQIRSNALSGSPTSYSSSVSTGGHNRMAIRAGFGDSGVEDLDGSDVSVYARGRLPIYANVNNATTTFYLARIDPFDAGRTLRISLYDIGEAANSGTLRVLPASEANVSTFTGCSFSRDDGASLTVSASQCKLSNISSSGTGYNGRLLTIDVPIPSNYDCDEGSSTGCWIRVEADFGTSRSVHDATTWSATILGNPVRLVE